MSIILPVFSEPIQFEHEIQLTHPANSMFDADKMIIRLKVTDDDLNGKIATFTKENSLEYSPKMWANIYLEDPEEKHLKPYEGKKFIEAYFVDKMILTIKCLPRLSLHGKQLTLKFFCVNTIFSHFRNVGKSEIPACIGYE